MSGRKEIGLITSLTGEIFKAEYFVRIISGIIDAFYQRDYQFKMIMVRDSEDPRVRLEEESVQGLLFLTWTIHQHYLEEARKMKIPAVVINDFNPDFKGNMIYGDNRAGVEQSLQHLKKAGRVKVGMLQAPDDASIDSRERYKLWCELLDKYELTADPAHYRKCEYFFEQDGYLKMMDIIQNSPTMPQAMLCFNDDIAIGAIRALKESWIMCPAQVAVIGYDGILKGKFVDPSLTTVSQPLEQMGGEMVRTVIDLIEGKLKEPVWKKFAPELVIRRSC
ncbi:MAG TPA: substrate-binding domain-containing protein [Candidatus Omnitrophota bacterium]|jgi:DNA-binding LacI/PurR family transcriptional regulator|nr:substrate-binding domain-containing protein [Candidatus Omnitrophota bacterium]